MPLLKFTLQPSLYMITLRLSHIALQTHVDLHTVHVSEELMQSISTLSSLQSLGLILDDIAPDSIQLWRWHCNSHTFPSLQDLSLRTYSVQTVASFLKLKSWLLRRVMITLEILTFDAGTREQLFWVLHDQCDRHLLEKIVISAEKSDTEDRPVADYQTFIPLMAFRNLTHLTLYSVMSLAIDDDALERLALAWPRLQHFRIVQQLGSYIWPNITLLGLALLLKHCPDL
ncbi:hypothetical protein F5I97DRAFT_114130 [Phlebopus sp. FC_14]|nr:hypothetical protein F5I97DRAFT_114130 [Phlebopus sp. FC_14]